MTTSTPDRHAKGAPASAGGQFATTPKTENGTGLLQQKIQEGMDKQQAIANRRHAAVQRLNDAHVELHIASLEMMKERVFKAVPDGVTMLLEWGRNGHRGYSLAAVNDVSGQPVWVEGDAGEAEEIIHDLGLDFADPEDILDVPDHQVVDEGEIEYVSIALLP